MNTFSLGEIEMDRINSNDIRLSVILPCYNEEEFIGYQLEALANQQWGEPWELIIVDNGSSDRTLEIIDQYKDQFPSCLVLRAHEKQGASHVRNVGVEAATGELIAFCDADDIVAPDWLATMAKAIEELDFVAGRFENHKLNSDEAAVVHSGSQQDDLLRGFAPDYLPYAGGGNLGIKRPIHDLIGGFDESLLAVEDTDYCWRVQQAGVKLHFASDLLVYRRLPTSLRKTLRQAFFWGKHVRSVYNKHRPLGIPKLGLSHEIKTLTSLALRLPYTIRSKKTRMVVFWQISFNLGRIRGYNGI